ncbi:hypothetical protein E4U33_002856 [Claviceps sp. LM78 group G4]|nr:hypothetical protein E4U33_002856 [Claviceps sp. LM78 group G4]
MPSWRLSLRPITCPRTPRLVLRTKEIARDIWGRERGRPSFHHGPPWVAVSRGNSWGDEDPALIAVAALLCFAMRLVGLNTRALVRHSGNWPLARAPVKPGTPPAWLLATISLSR